MSLVTLGNKEKIRVSLFEDNVYLGAKDLLLDLNRYYDIFTPVPHTVEIQTYIKMTIIIVPESKT